MTKKKVVLFKKDEKGFLVPNPDGKAKDYKPKTDHPQTVNEGPTPFVFIKSVSVPSDKGKYGRKSYAAYVLQHLASDDALKFHFKGYGYIMGDPLAFVGEEKEITDIINESLEMDQVVTPGEGKAVKKGDIK